MSKRTIILIVIFVVVLIILGYFTNWFGFGKQKKTVLVDDKTVIPNINTPRNLLSNATSKTTIQKFKIGDKIYAGVNGANTYSSNKANENEVVNIYSPNQLIGSFLEYDSNNGLLIKILTPEFDEVYTLYIKSKNDNPYTK